MQKPSHLRDASIDIIKIIATFAVITIHLSGYGLYEFEIGSFGWISAAFWDTITRFAVPSFLMCTGALMLSPERDLPIKRLIRSYFLRILIILLFWAFAYRLVLGAGTAYLNGEGFSYKIITDSVYDVLMFRHHTHLYYLQLLLLCYILLPPIRHYVKTADDKLLDYTALLFASLAIVLPTLFMFFPFSQIGDFIKLYGINMTYRAVGYMFFGYYLYRKPPNPSRLWIYIVSFVIGFALVFGLTWFLSLRSGSVYTDILGGMTLGPLLMSYGLFEAVRVLSLGREASSRLVYISSLTFGIYLIHHFFVMAFRQFGFDVHFTNPFFGIPLEVFAAFILSFAGSALLNKFSFTKYFISTGAKRNEKISRHDSN